MKKINNLNKIKRVRFFDYSNYDTEKSNNGGCYGFWTDYIKLDNGEWKISYGTTSDMDFCPCCGRFNCNNNNCNFEITTEDNVLKTINNFKETENEWIEYK